MLQMPRLPQLAVVRWGYHGRISARVCFCLAEPNEDLKKWVRQMAFVFMMTMHIILRKLPQHLPQPGRGTRMGGLLRYFNRIRIPARSHYFRISPKASAMRTWR